MYPVKDVYVTCSFGVRGTSWAAGYHTGMDFRAAVNTPIYATWRGTVIHAGWGGSYGSAYGNYVVIRSRTRLGRTRHVLYAHLSREIVSTGQSIRAGQTIGYSGITGNTFGPHLHYEERVSPFGYWNHKDPVFLAYKPLDRAIVSLHKVAPGRRNRHIIKVQRQLNKHLGGTDLPVTGYYGSQTKQHAKRWQEKLGYTGKDADGVLGRRSLKRLGFRVIP